MYGVSRPGRAIRHTAATVAATPPRYWRFVPAALIGGRRRENTPRRPVFFLSTGRVGTKTLAALLSHSHGALATHEPEPAMFELSSLAYANGDEYRSVSRVLDAAVLACRGPLVDLADEAGRRFVETSPQATFLAPNIAAVWPEARFVAVVRHPAAVVRSGMRRSWYAGHSHDHVRLVPRDGRQLAEFSTWSALEKNCWLWAATNHWILDFARSSHGAVEVLKSEDLLSDATGASALFEVLGLDPPSERAIARLLRKRMNSQQTGDFPPWSGWSDDDRRTLEKVTGDIAAELGYEL